MIMRFVICFALLGLLFLATLLLAWRRHPTDD